MCVCACVCVARKRQHNKRLGAATGEGRAAFLVESLEFEPVNVMFGRRFPFLPSNWCRGNFGFLKGEGEEKKATAAAAAEAGGKSWRRCRMGRRWRKNKPTELQSCTEPKLGFNGCYSRRARLGSLRRENGVALEK